MSVPRPTEMTVRDLLQEELRKRGVTVIPEFSVSTPTGLLKPDILLKNGAPYVVETKLGAETKLLEAMVKLYDYSKYVTEAKGAFAVLFPEELRRPWPHEVWMRIAVDPKLECSVVAIFKDLRPSQPFKGNLSEIADWMAGQVLRAPVVEADTSFAIRILREASDYLNIIARQLKADDLKDIYGGKTVFENILQYEEGKYPLDEMRHAAAYLLINQLLFYHVLSRVDASFLAVDEERIRRPSDLTQYFEPVLKRNYSSIFGFDVASRLPVDATEVVKKVVMVVKALAPEKIRHDVLGKVFHELIPFEIRKAVAAFYTNNEAAEILAQLAIDKPDAKVMDLAVGSGTLLVAAYRRKRELLQKVKGTIELEDHRRFLEQDLTGIDIMPFAAHLAVVHLSLQALLYETERVRVAVWDSTELKPGQTIPAIWSELKVAYRRPTLDLFVERYTPSEEAYVTKGAVTLEGIGGEKIPLEQVDVVIMNPPFTRQERLPTTYKNALSNRLTSYSSCLHGRLGLYGYFVFLADRFTKDGGRIALVLPATILRIGSTLMLRKFLTTHYHIEYVVTTWQRAAFSEGAQFREILLVAKKLAMAGRKDLNVQGLRSNIVTLKRLPKNVGQAIGFAEKIRTLSKSISGVYEDEDLIFLSIPQDELKAYAVNLFRFISAYNPNIVNIWDNIVEKGSDKLVEIGVYAERGKGRLVRGVETKSGGMKVQAAFILRTPSTAIKVRDAWILNKDARDYIITENRFTGAKVKVPRTALRCGLRRMSGIGIIDATDQLDYVVVNEFPEADGFFGKKTTKLLSEWKKQVEDRSSFIALARRFDISASGTKLLAFYSSKLMAPTEVMSLITNLPEEEAKILTLWVNSTPHILQAVVERIETRGAYMELPEWAMKHILVLDPSKLSKIEKKELVAIFDKISKNDFPSLMEQLKVSFHLRVEIDRAVLGVLGFGDDEINRLLDYLYPALANEIQQLKTLMQG